MPSRRSASLGKIQVSGGNSDRKGSIRRPRIPADMEQQILIEAGHRCAVCGEPLPLDRAHIIPWHKSKEHKVEDLICLCPNCHRRADAENWGQGTLREYKLRPWVVRRFESNSSSTNPRLRLMADLLDGAAEINGGGQCEGVRFSSWQVWLEIYLAPSGRLPASIPIHRITGSLEVSGLCSAGFGHISLETASESPPDTLHLLYGRKARPKQLVVRDPITAILVAYCQTPEWADASRSDDDGHVRFKLEVAEADYEPLEIVAPLEHLQYAGSTKWRLWSDQER